LHGITDDAVASGLDAGEALDRVLDALTGRVLVGHYARMEVGFLSQLCARVHGRRPPLTVVDTLELHQRVLAPGFDAGFAPRPARCTRCPATVPPTDCPTRRRAPSCTSHRPLSCGSGVPRCSGISGYRGDGEAPPRIAGMRLARIALPQGFAFVEILGDDSDP